jgi:Emfourin
MSGEPWHIQLERSGGFAGVSFRADVDSSTLEPAAAAELERLADAVDFSHAPAAQPGVPDAFQYHLVAEHGPERHELTLGESQLDPPLKELVQWLMQRARNPKP